MTTGVRTTPHHSEQTGPGWGAIALARGPLNLTRPRGNNFVAGEWDRDPAGTTVTVPCEGWPGNGSYDELITSMTAADTGAWIANTYIDYTSGGADYTLVVPWDHIMCGTAVDHSGCDPVPR